MDVQITDAAELRRVVPIALRAYIQSSDWDYVETWRGRIEVWSKEHDGQTSQILLPLRELSRGYAIRIHEAVEMFSELEGRSQLEVYHDLLGARADVTMIRFLNHAGAKKWSLADSAEFLDCARKLLTAAARAAERPNEPVYRGRSSSEVADYVRGVQALPGYEDHRVLTLHSHVPAGFGDQAYMSDEVRPPFSRQAALALNNGLLGARAAAAALIGGAKVSTVFENAKPKGVSANFCEAIADLTKQGGDVEIGQRWAAVRPSSAANGAFTFTESYAEALSDGADWLRRHSPFVNAHVTGEVVLLSKDYKADFDGECVIVHELDERPVGLKVNIRKGDHPEVIRAFEQNLEVSVYGDIHRKGNKYSLENPRQFSVSPVRP